MNKKALSVSICLALSVAVKGTARGGKKAPGPLIVDRKKWTSSLPDTKNLSEIPFIPGAANPAYIVDELGMGLRSFKLDVSKDVAAKLDATKTFVIVFLHGVSFFRR